LFVSTSMGYVLELRADSRIIPDWAWKSGRHPKKLAHILYFIFNFLTLGFLIFISTFRVLPFSFRLMFLLIGSLLMLRVCWDQSSLAEEEEVLEVLAVQPRKQELDLE
jgi:hypothetical protein